MTPILLSGAAPLLASVRRMRAGLEQLQPAAQLAARVYVGQVFLASGLTKLRDWDSTLALFQNEYQVPLLDPVLAAWLGTAGELVLPVLLVLGLGGRLAALGLSVVNAVAVASLADVPVPALQQHVFWGSLLLGLLLWGPGRWALDAWLAPRLAARLASTGVAPVAGDGRPRSRPQAGAPGPGASDPAAGPPSARSAPGSSR